MANLAKPSVDGRPTSKTGIAKLGELPTLQAGAQNGGPHPLQMPILFENLELDHSMAWASVDTATWANRDTVKERWMSFIYFNGMWRKSLVTLIMLVSW
jgi:hypothetical protein